MALPQSPLMEGREAQKCLRECFGLSGAEIDSHLNDLVDAHPELIKWIGETPPYFPAAEDLDFFSGQYVKEPSKTVPLYYTLDYGPQEYHRIPGRAYRFKIWRHLFEELSGIVRAPSLAVQTPPALVGGNAMPAVPVKVRHDREMPQVEEAVRRLIDGHPDISGDDLEKHPMLKEFKREQIRKAASVAREKRPRGRPKNSP